MKFGRWSLPTVGIGLLGACASALPNAGWPVRTDCTEVALRDGERAGKKCFIVALARCDPAVLERASSHVAIEGRVWQRERAWIESDLDLDCTVVIEMGSSDDGVRWHGETRYHHCTSVDLDVSGDERSFVVSPMTCKVEQL